MRKIIKIKNNKLAKQTIRIIREKLIDIFCDLNVVVVDDDDERKYSSG